jgi:hypothetical protein
MPFQWRVQGISLHSRKEFNFVDEGERGTLGDILRRTVYSSLVEPREI